MVSFIFSKRDCIQTDVYYDYYGYIFLMNLKLLIIFLIW